jgi:hypothetical protein
MQKNICQNVGMQSYDALFQWQYILGKCQTAPSPKSNLFKYFYNIF